MSRPRTVGVMGGMGPAATWDFCARLLALAPAERDQDHPRVLVDCDGNVPDRSAAVAGRGPSPGPRLARMARGLEASGAELLCMPCNSAHAFVDDVRAAARVPFVDMIGATARAVREAAPGARRAGVLATTATVDAGLYARALAAEVIAVVPTDAAAQEELMRLIYAVKAGDRSATARARMLAVAADLARDGAEVVVAACTEVPLLLGEDEAPVPVVSSTDALARAVVDAAMRTQVGP